jgi:putative heme-binding domain-containing protein
LAAIDSGVKHGDWRVRRLAINLLRRYGVEKADAVAAQLAGDADPAVRVAAARARVRPEERCAAAVAALKSGAASDVHLRYEAASILAPVIDEATLTSLVRDSDPNLRLAGLIAIDRESPAARAVLARSIADPGPTETDLLLDLAQLHRSPEVLEGLRGLVRRNDLPAGVTGRALLVLRAMTNKKGDVVDGEAVRRFLKAVEAGEIVIKSPRDAITLLELLETDGPSPFALQTIGRMLVEIDGGVREAAHRLARLHGTKASSLADAIWARVGDPQDKRPPADRLADLTTLMAVEAEPKVDNWARLLTEGDPLLVADAVRSWRQFAGNATMTKVLQDAAAGLVKRLPELQADLAAVAAALKIDKTIAPQVDLPAVTADDAAFAAAAVAATRTPAGDALGRRVFERTGCVKCHAAGSQGTERAPPLAGIGRSQKVDYLIEAVLEPSKIIKTGFEIETITLQDGRVFSGLVKDEKDTLRIVMPDAETRVKKADVDERIVQRKSLMPEGQHRQLSPREFADLVGYLQSL